MYSSKMGPHEELYTLLRLTVVICCSFIRLADYLIVNMMHMLAVNSISALLTAFTAQLMLTPPTAVIRGWTSVLDEIPEVPDPDDVRQWSLHNIDIYTSLFRRNNGS